MQLFYRPINKETDLDTRKSSLEELRVLVFSTLKFTFLFVNIKEKQAVF